MLTNLNIIRSLNTKNQPSDIDFKHWLTISLIKSYQQLNIELLIVSTNKAQEFNFKYRQLNYPTNIISLEYATTRDNFAILNGELIMCHKVIKDEALVQKKSIVAHYAHLFIHGMLHLQGWDHLSPTQAKKMETKEIFLLKQIGIDDPYFNNLN